MEIKDIYAEKVLVIVQLFVLECICMHVHLYITRIQLTRSYVHSLMYDPRIPVVFI